MNLFQAFGTNGSCVLGLDGTIVVLGHGDVCGWVKHMDHGSQVRSRKLQRAVTIHEVAGPTGRVSAEGDNAVLQSAAGNRPEPDPGIREAGPGVRS